jgi:hypothetical protein
VKYKISLIAHAGTTIDFETDETDPEKIAEAFWDSNPDTPSLCHQCSGGKKYSQNLELGDEWEIDRFDGKLSINPAVD